MQQILLAFDGRLDRAIKTNPFGAKPKPPPASPDRIASSLLKGLRRHQNYRIAPAAKSS